MVGGRDSEGIEEEAGTVKRSKRRTVGGVGRWKGCGKQQKNPELRI